jgi:hypothetical protein
LDKIDMALIPFFQNLVSFPQEKRQRLLLIILAGVVSATLIIIYFGFFRPSPAPAVGPTISEGTSPEEIIEEIDFDINFLKNPNFRKLKTYGEWPPEIEERGRVNPFLPY